MVAITVPPITTPVTNGHSTSKKSYAVSGSGSTDDNGANEYPVCSPRNAG